MPTRTLAAAVLCGGKSSRFGSDKARAHLDSLNTPMLTEIVQQLSSIGYRPFILSGQKQRYADLGFFGLPDFYENIGPIGGIHAALSCLHTQAVIILTCDMPMLHTDDLNYLIQSWSAATEGVFFTLDTQTKPFPCIYSTSILATVEKQIESGDFSMRSLIAKMKTVKRLTPLHPSRFMNINTQSEFRSFHELAQLE